MITHDDPRKSVAEWMIAHGFATGHGDTLADLLAELSWQIAELRREKTGAQNKKVRTK